MADDPGPYDRLLGRLEGALSPKLSTLPDGSVDRHGRLLAGSTERFETREAFGRALVEGDRSAFRFAVSSIEPGGQAVNVAEQAQALGASVTCYGHLDHPVFESVEFETVSMGPPATVTAIEFDDSDLMIVENAAVGEWTFEALHDVVDPAAVLDVEAVCCSNWQSIPGLTEAFRRFGQPSVDRVPFVVDPGDIVGHDPSAIAELLDALSTLQETVDVVYNVNRQELRETAGAIMAEPPGGDFDRLVAVRNAAELSAVVLHARGTAAAATRTGTESVENLMVERPIRRTGGGDHFTGGLGVALACGWDWPVALACGNACSSYYVATASSGSPAAVRAFVEDRR